MLKGVNPLLPPDLLALLRAMGHGDEIAIVDANYPAMSAGPQVVRCDGLSAPVMLDAVLSLMPLDDYAEAAAWRMEVIGAPHQEEPVFAEFCDIIARNETKHFPIAPLERFAFYERTSACFAIIATGERRLYGNVILKKGILRPE